MIRRGVKVQLAAFAVLTAVGVSYVGVRYAGLGDDAFGRRYTVAADFADSGGIFTGAEVTYRGVEVGRVGTLRLTPGGVRVDLRIERSHTGRRIPADTLAVVANRSAVGEQYLDLQPRRNGGPYLHEGSFIPRQDTRTPLSTAVLLLNLDRLVNSVDTHDLTTVVDELGKAFAGTGPALGRLIDSGDALTEAASESLPETVKLLEDGRTVLGTQRDEADAIASFARDLATLTAQLRSSDPDLRKVLTGGIAASAQVDDLLRTVGPTLPVLLGNLISTGQVVVARLPGVRQVLVTYPIDVAGGFTVTPGDGTAHFGLELNLNDPPACTRGYEGTHRRVPQETSSVPANTAARCTAPRSSGQLVRGAQNAPSGGRNGDQTVTSPGRPSFSTQQPVSGPQTYVAGYDPVTGEAVGPDGRPLVIGSYGGQQRLLGEDSWQWLLLGPLVD